MKDRDIHGYWWVWREGDDWPSWLYGEQRARDEANRYAFSCPGKKVWVGNLNIVETVVLPDKLVITQAYS